MAKVDLKVDDSGALSYQRTKLIDALKAELEKREKERQEAKEKAAAKNKEARDRIVAALDNPQFLVWAVSQFEYQGFDPTSADFASEVAKAWQDTNGEDLPEDRHPDRNLKRLIRVYELADDATVTVNVTDETYKYL